MTKGIFQSKTVLSILALALTNLAQLVVDNSEAIQVALLAWVPAPWNALVPPLVGFLVVLVALLGVEGRVNAKTKIEGLW